jgi:hypothetical protein
MNRFRFLWRKSEIDLELVALGGAGSGNFGHEGRPGEVGGSGGSGGADSSKERPSAGFVQKIHQMAADGRTPEEINAKFRGGPEGWVTNILSNYNPDGTPKEGFQKPKAVKKEKKEEKEKKEPVAPKPGKPEEEEKPPSGKIYMPKDPSKMSHSELVAELKKCGVDVQGASTYSGSSQVGLKSMVQAQIAMREAGILPTDCILAFQRLGPHTYANARSSTKTITVNSRHSSWQSESSMAAAMLRDASIGWHPTNNSSSVLVHEMGHLLHGKSNPSEFQQWKATRLGGGKKIAMSISRYAAKNSREFVAETFTKAVFHGASKISDSARSLYKKHGGPYLGKH